MGFLQGNAPGSWRPAAIIADKDRWNHPLFMIICFLGTLHPFGWVDVGRERTRGFFWMERFANDLYRSFEMEHDL